MVSSRSMIGFSVLAVLIFLLILSGIAVGLVFLIRGILRRKRRSEADETQAPAAGSLGERIRQNRIRCKMTQEFVAEQLGVSRQAVSKWENGTSEPSTANLLALAKLFGMSVGELLQEK